MRRSIRNVSGLVVVILASAALASAQEMKFEALPAPLQEAVKAKFPDIKVVTAVKEKNEEGVMIYEISLDNNGMGIDATYGIDNKFMMMEKQIDRKDLPEAVAKPLEAKYPKAKYKTVEEVYKATDKEDALDHFEVVLTTPQKQIRGVEIAPDGKILKVEKRTSETED